MGTLAKETADRLAMAGAHKESDDEDFPYPRSRGQETFKHRPAGLAAVRQYWSMYVSKQWPRTHPHTHTRALAHAQAHPLHLVMYFEPSQSHTHTLKPRQTIAIPNDIINAEAVSSNFEIHARKKKHTQVFFGFL